MLLPHAGRRMRVARHASRALPRCTVVNRVVPGPVHPAAAAEGAGTVGGAETLRHGEREKPLL